MVQPDERILKEDTLRRIGREAQRSNIHAARLVAEAVRTTLGPRGMDKMLVDPQGNVTVTNDGATILREMHIDHPCARMVAEVAATQERAVGDGTTTAVILAGTLLAHAETLIDEGIHPGLITQGYRSALGLCTRTLHEIAMPVRVQDTALLQQLARTAMTGKGVEHDRDALAAMIVDAAQAGLTRESLRVLRHVGPAVGTSERIDGIILPKGRLHTAMPPRVAPARIALLDLPLEVKGAGIDTRITISTPSSLQGFLDMEEGVLRGMVERIKASGANTVISMRGIDDLAVHLLAREGIYAVRRVMKDDIERLARAIGGRIVNSLDDVRPEDLGHADSVYELLVGDDARTCITGCPCPAATILLRGTTEHVLAEAHRAVEDAIGDVTAAITGKAIVGGAGAIEAELAHILRSHAAALDAREQRIIHSFATGLELIPATLAENAGMDPAEALQRLRAAHERGERWAGIDVRTGLVADAMDAGVIEPVQVKGQALVSAVEVAVMVLRIDDVILAAPERRDGADRDPRA